MSFFDRIFVGKTIKDFGVVEEKSIGIGKTKTSALLTKKKGEYLFVIKTSAWAILGASVNYREFKMDTASKLKDFISDSENIVNNQPLEIYD